MTVHVTLATLLAERMENPGDGFAALHLEGQTVGEVLLELTSRHPALHVLVWRDKASFSPMLAAFLNQQNIQALQGLDTPVKDGDELMVVSALEGG